MKYFVPLRLRLEKEVVTRVVRDLRGKGQINVRVGQEVQPSDIIGSSAVSAGFRTLNLAQLLSVSPQSVEQYLAKVLDQRIYKGELLASKKSWALGGKTVVTAPTDGVLDFLNTKTGELRIAFLPKKIDLPAGVYGVVEGVDPQKGQVVLRTLTSRIHGILGSGRPRDGILHILGKKDDLINKDKISVKYDGQILIGGSLLFKDAISAAISEGIEGIITGGINAKDYKAMAGSRLMFPKKIDNDIGISIIACEGFGSISIGSDIFDQLLQYEGKFVFIDGNKALICLPSFTSSSMVKVKNSSLPQLPSSNINQNFDKLVEDVELKAGLKVRIVGNSYMGEQGIILAIDQSITLLPSGARNYLATIETARRKIQVPVANLEIIM